MPIGSAIIIQRTIPPRTSEKVTGAAAPTMVVTGWRLTNECPRFGDLR
jgi:hypothetical protein